MAGHLAQRPERLRDGGRVWPPAAGGCLHTTQHTANLSAHATSQRTAHSHCHLADHLEYLSDVRYVSKMLGAVVNHFGSGGPGQQLLRAWQVMDNLGQRVAATTAVMDVTQSQILSHSLARVGLPVTVESAAGPSWRGRVVGTTRNGVWVEALDPSSWRNGREAKGIFQFDKVRMEKQSLEERIQEDLQIWWREARGLYGDGC